MSSKKIFLSDLDQNQIEAICFRNGFHYKSAQTDCFKEMWIPILKRLKHLNLFLGAHWRFTKSFILLNNVTFEY